MLHHAVALRCLVLFEELTFVGSPVAWDAVGFGLNLRVTEATRGDFVVLLLPVGCVCDPERNGVGAKSLGETGPPFVAGASAACAAR